MRASTLAIVALWTATVVEAAWGVWSKPVVPRATETTTSFGLVSIVLPLVFFPFVGVRIPRSPFLVESLARWIDARSGAGAYEAFLKRLKPILMFSIAALAMGAAMLARDASGDAPSDARWITGFAFSAATGLALLHLVLKRRGVPGV